MHQPSAGRQLAAEDAGDHFVPRSSRSPVRGLGNECYERVCHYPDRPCGSSTRTYSQAESSDSGASPGHFQRRLHPSPRTPPALPDRDTLEHRRTSRIDCRPFRRAPFPVMPASCAVNAALQPTVVGQLRREDAGARHGQGSRGGMRAGNRGSGRVRQRLDRRERPHLERLVAGVVGRLGNRCPPAALANVAAFRSRSARSTGHQRRINNVRPWVECERAGGVHCSWLSRVAP